MIAAPVTGRRYWLGLACASVLGANLGDCLSRELGLGYWRGLPVLAALFGCVVLGARAVPRTAAWYWTAIVVVRAAATNLSDWQVLTSGEPPQVRSPLSFPIVIAAWSVAFALLVWRDRRRDPAARAQGGTGAAFWLTMLVAGTAGTALGDWLAFGSGLEPPGALALTSALFALALWLLSGRARASAVAFWVPVFAVRTWGTNVGDGLADGLGLLQGTALSAAVTLVALLAFGPGLATEEPAGSGARAPSRAQ